MPSVPAGGATDLTFQGLRVENYNFGGLLFAGGTKVENGRKVPNGYGANRNTVKGMVFSKLGSRHAGGAPGYGAITLENSRYNTIQGNSFSALENVTSPGNFHGVYLAHGSSSNSVTGNTFTTISGDPVRVRNDSNANEVSGNTFTRAGAAAYYSDWFCDSTKNFPDSPTNKPCTTPYKAGVTGARQASECASHRNYFRNNKLVSGYKGKLPSTGLFPPGQTYAGQHPECSNAGQQRVYS